MLEVRDLHAGYGGGAVLHGVSLDVADGELVSVLGPNGAGKTTLLRALNGVLAGVRGSVRLNGKELRGLAPHSICAAGLAHVPEGRRLFAELTVLENLLLGAVGGAVGKERRKELVQAVYDLFPQLAERTAQRAGSLSGGEQQMAAIGRGLMGDPKLLLIDECSLGLAPAVVHGLYESLRSLSRDHGIGVMAVEQMAGEALEESDRIVLMADGEIRATGAPGDMLHHSELAALVTGTGAPARSGMSARTTCPP